MSSLSRPPMPNVATASRGRSPITAAALAAAILFIVAPAPAENASAGLPGTGATHASEVARIRAHFDSVVHELRAADVSHLTSARRLARGAHLAELAAYRDQGNFPHNHGFADSWMPYFVDHRGVACAVAHLLVTSGRRDIVERVAAADNNVWVADLAGDAEFREWLDASGLTLAEAARIQVPYIITPDDPTAARSNGINTAAAIVAGSLGAAAIAWNVRDPAEGRAGLRAALGYTAGALGLAVAASRADADGTPLAVGAVSGVIGIGSSIMATQTLLGSRRAKQRAAAGAAQDNGVAMSIAPSVHATGSQLSPALTLNIRF